ncbi:putative AAA+ superfamily ATPase [Paucibacter oligotrophus]|uniref:Putative AAA+ superfamily ATPase n=1 Tax=Roseateles oligotrophus TaxID=1769250 RepID=A0A840L6M4_9BURK|nr:ATP-binding protein [Roseateles oligotrophus]MBB4843441.1 putative AAA+ superfamily ATPase [Roseateles oligotrophus]
MKRYLDARVTADLATKAVVLTGPRQVGKTTLARQLLQTLGPGQYLNWDVPADRAVLNRQSWLPSSRLLVLDEIHKMPGWKSWLKGVIDARPPEQALLVTGSARMETFRQSGESLAGRYFALRLHPFSVREWCDSSGATPDAALSHLLERGGFPEPCLASDLTEAARWRQQYITDLIREDVLEFSRLQEIGTMRVFVELLRERVGSPLSLASIARDLAVAPATLRRYLDILQALFIVFTVQPWHHNIARSLLQAPKVYFFDTGLVRGDAGLVFENAVAAMLLKHVQWQVDSQGLVAGLHYIRTKDGAEIDFALSRQGQLSQLIECKLSDAAPHRALMNFAARFEQASAVQLVCYLRQPEQRGPVSILPAASWLAALDA